MPVQSLKIACAGLGRMGKRHALHFLERTPRAQGSRDVGYSVLEEVMVSGFGHVILTKLDLD